MSVKAILTAAVEQGLTIIVHNQDDPNEPDYVGDNVRDAIEAIENVDECEVTIDGDDESGWMLIVNDLDEDEQIADCSGWADVWLDAN
jgi:hypothetical protein